MARLIDADDFLKRLNERPVDYIDPGCDFYYFEETVESVLNETPTVDAVPVVHGRWKKDKNVQVMTPGGQKYHNSCSVCGWLTRLHNLNYCPNCGAVMDLKEESDA